MRIKGEITVFTSLILMCLLSLFLTAFEAARTVGLNYLFHLAGESALESLFAGYHKELYENYHVFFLNLPYQEIQNEIKDYVSDYGKPGNLLSFSCTNVDFISGINAADHGGSVFWQAAIDSLGYSMAEEQLNRFLRQETLMQEGETIRKQVQDTAFTLEQFEELQDAEELDLEPGLFEWAVQKMGGFHVNYIFSMSQSLSGKRAGDLTGLPSRSARSDTDALDMIKETAFLSYLQQNFSSFSSKKNNYSPENVFDYEMEYILCGYQSDEENISAVISRILLLREGMNSMSILADSAKMERIKAAALAIALLLEMPGMETAIQYIIVMLMAYGDAIKDIKNLLKGERVPLFTSSGQEGKDERNGLNYEEYLMCFLFIQNRYEKRFRAMDLIQLNIQIQQPMFTISRCIWQISLRIAALDKRRKEQISDFSRCYQ